MLLVDFYDLVRDRTYDMTYLFFFGFIFIFGAGYIFAGAIVI